MQHSIAATAWQVPPALVAHTKPIYGFYVTYGQRYMFQHFSALFAAKHFIDLMLQGDDYHRTDDFTILSARGVTIRIENPKGRKGPSLFDQVLEYEFTKDELDFEFPDTLLQQYRPFPSSPFVRERPQAEETPNLSNDQQPAPKVAQRAPKAPQPAKPAGLVSVADIAQSLNIDPKHARQALRKAKIEKPEFGWAFPQSEVEAITKAIKEHLK